MTDAAESGSEYESDLDVDLTDTDTDDEIDINEAVPVNRTVVFCSRSGDICFARAEIS